MAVRVGSGEFPLSAPCQVTLIAEDCCRCAAGRALRRVGASGKFRANQLICVR